MGATTASIPPIGVFDSGVGGLTVVRELRRALPHEPLVYLGDTARVPYGTKSAETVIRYSRACARFLLGHGVRAVLVACNTASAAALDTLRRELDVPVLGAVEPGARAAVAATRSGRIGVLGTLGTVRSEAYPRALRGLRGDVHVSAVPCPLLVPLAEEGWTEGEVARLTAERYLCDLRALDAEIDTVVLGCTHYPLLRPLLDEVAASVFGRRLSLVDSATAMANAARDLLGTSTASGESGRARVFVTDRARLAELGPRFLGAPIDPVEETDLEV